MIRRLWWKFKDWKFNKKMAHQRKKKGYADIDIWSLDYWFANTVSKMIYELRDTKHGAPELPFEEIEQFPMEWVDEQSKILLEKKKIRNSKIKNEDDKYEEEVDLWGENKIFDRWWLILSRIAWCLERSCDDFEIENEYSDEYFNQAFSCSKTDNFKEWWKANFEIDKVDDKGKPKTYKLINREVDKELKEKYWNREEEIGQYREACKDEAMDLIKKYFYALWD